MKTYIAMVFLALWIQWGCAGNKEITSRVEGDQPIAETTPGPGVVGSSVPSSVVEKANEKYKVIKGDSLWKIAGKVYQGGFSVASPFQSQPGQHPGSGSDLPQTSLGGGRWAR